MERGVFWWKEWRWTDGVLQVRYLYRLPNGTIVGNGHADPCDPDDAWRDWRQGETLQEAIHKGIDDTSFFEADSRCPEHAEAVSRRKAKIVAERRWENARRALAEFQFTQSRLFAKRHGHKIGTDEYERALAKTWRRLRPKYDRLVAALVEASSHLKSLR
jgi:hypothetical protein